MKDKFHATYFLFYALGVSTAIPSNFFTTATDVCKFFAKINLKTFRFLVLDVQISQYWKWDVQWWTSNASSSRFHLKYFYCFTCQLRDIPLICSKVSQGVYHTAKNYIVFMWRNCDVSFHRGLCDHRHWHL